MNTIEKYNGKTIRINGSVYRIEIISNISEISVYLHPLTGGDIAHTNIDTSSYGCTHGGKTFCMAVDKAYEIQKEIQSEFETDF